ncbi:MAG: hypothetical protein OXC68_14115, partial [Aestuariivita sp.]|nr:hypothetical protein [Aestuariivita sp.]
LPPPDPNTTSMNRNPQTTPSAVVHFRVERTKNKKGASVDRCRLLEDPKTLLRQKAEEMANPDANRIPWGYCIGKAKQIRSIIIVGSKSQQAFKICPSPIINTNNPKPWDAAHTIIVKFDSSYARSQVRGVRDKLIHAFSSKIHAF